MVKRIPKQVREEILTKVKLGKKVKVVAEQYGISDRTIYAWLTKDSGDEIVSVLKYNKLKRENQELKRLLGEITLKYSLTRGEKNRTGSSR